MNKFLYYAGEVLGFFSMIATFYIVTVVLMAL